MLNTFFKEELNTETVVQKIKNLAIALAKYSYNVKHVLLYQLLYLHVSA